MHLLSSHLVVVTGYMRKQSGTRADIVGDTNCWLQDTDDCGPSDKDQRPEHSDNRLEDISKATTEANGHQQADVEVHDQKAGQIRC